MTRALTLTLYEVYEANGHLLMVTSDPTSVELEPGDTMAVRDWSTRAIPRHAPSPAAAPAHPMGMNPNRAPKGIPTGGQYTAGEHADSAATLDDDVQAADRMAFEDAQVPPEPDSGHCTECGGMWVADPDGSPGVKVHYDEDEMRVDHDADEDHTAVPEPEEFSPEALHRMNVAATQEALARYRSARNREDLRAGGYDLAGASACLETTLLEMDDDEGAVTVARRMRQARARFVDGLRDGGPVPGVEQRFLEDTERATRYSAPTEPGADWSGGPGATVLTTDSDGEDQAWHAHDADDRFPGRYVEHTASRGDARLAISPGEHSYDDPGFAWAAEVSGHDYSGWAPTRDGAAAAAIVAADYVLSGEAEADYWLSVAQAEAEYTA